MRISLSETLFIPMFNDWQIASRITISGEICPPIEGALCSGSIGAQVNAWLVYWRQTTVSNLADLHFMESAGQKIAWTDVTLIYYSEFPVYDPGSTSNQVEIAWHLAKIQDFRAVARYHMQPPGCRGPPSFSRSVKLYPSQSPIFCTRGHIETILFTRRLLDIRFAKQRGTSGIRILKHQLCRTART